MMKAAVVTAFKKPLEVKEVPIPKPGPNDVLVKHIACGVCHTDLHAAHGDWDVKPELPRIPGHEGVGEIVELGSMVADHLKKGDIVGIPWLHASCLHCEFCLTGRETLCKQQVNSGYSCDGSFGEYALMDANFAVKLPEGMDPYKSAPLYCAGVTVYKALKVSQVKPGQWVSIVGVGGLGSVAVKYAVAMGMRVATVVAPNDKTAVQLSKDFGAEVVFDGPPDQHGQWMQENTGGVHGAVITVPIVSAFEQAFQSVRRGGRVVAVALPNGKMAVPIVDCVLGGIELVGSIVGTRQDLRECLEIAKLHKIECKVQKRKLEEINEIFDDMLHYRISGRVVIDYTAK